MKSVNSFRLPVYGAYALSVGVSTPSNIPAGISGCVVQFQYGIANSGSPLSLRMVKRLHDGLKIPYESLLAEVS